MSGPMNLNTRILVVLISIGMFFYIINLLRTQKLKEEFGLLWLITGFSVLIGSFLVDWLDSLSYFLGIEYPPAMIFLFAFLALLFVSLQFSIHITRLSENNKVLIQELAILTHQVEDIKNETTKMKEIINSS